MLPGRLWGAGGAGGGEVWVLGAGGSGESHPWLHTLGYKLSGLHSNGSPKSVRPQAFGGDDDSLKDNPIQFLHFAQFQRKLKSRATAKLLTIQVRGRAGLRPGFSGSRGSQLLCGGRVGGWVDQ